MSSFKLIGIRPINGCGKRFKKNLKSKRLYLLDQRYKVNYDQNYCITGLTIDYSEDDIPKNFYSSELNIQINAIVGENGSGKSALAELFLYFNFIYGIDKNLISKHQYNSNAELGNSAIFKQKRFTQEIREVRNFLKVELCFVYKDKIYLVRFDEGSFDIKLSSKIDTAFKFDEIVKFSDFEFPFYSMYVNYSHYGLNTILEGEWLRTLFHKNDGYQLPIVINPFRELGNIDINIENHLSRNRVLTNLVDTADEDIVIPGASIKFIEVARNSNKDLSHIKNLPHNKLIIDNLIIPLYSKFFSDEKYPEILDNNHLDNESYLIEKIKTITERYEDYREYRDMIFNFIENHIIPEIGKVNELINLLYKDRSHVTLKVRQSLNYLRKDIYRLDTSSNRLEITLFSLIEVIGHLKNDVFFTETIDYLPPPIFITRIHFKDKSHFDKLSSGEKQQIYSVHSIIYHIKNIDSVHHSAGDRLTYDSVFLVLDEIELYYHPDAQKKTISRLLYVLEKAQLTQVKNINMLFLTHSPFILSDIPSQSVAKLKDGQLLSDQTTEKTFAANITDLLTDSFFLRDGLIGDFAKSKIEEVIGFLNYRLLEAEIKRLEFEIDPNLSERENRTNKLELEYKRSLLNDLQEFRNMQFNIGYLEKFIELVDEPLLKNGIEQLFEKTKKLIG